MRHVSALAKRAPHSAVASERAYSNTRYYCANATSRNHQLYPVFIIRGDGTMLEISLGLAMIALAHVWNSTDRRQIRA